MKKLIIFAIIILAGCTPKRQPPVVHYGLKPGEDSLNASIEASAIHGIIYRMAPTGSMEPTLSGGDIIVVDNHFPYENIEVGFMLTYQAQWLPRTSPPVTHWAAEKQGAFWIMDGQHNAHYESQYNQLLRKEDFEFKDANGIRVGGKVVAVYTQRIK